MPDKVERKTVPFCDPPRGADDDGPASGFPPGPWRSCSSPKGLRSDSAARMGRGTPLAGSINQTPERKNNTMNTTSVNRSFGFPISSLYGEAQRLLTALQDATIATPVIAHLPATFVADFAAQVALVAQNGTDQSSAAGTTNALTHSKAQTALAYRQIAAYARRCAEFAFPDQDPLLRSEFLVGIRAPRDLNSVLDRARTLLAAVQEHSSELAPQGW